VFTGALFETAQLGDRFWLVGPYGDFLIPPEASSRTIVVAGGTGFAPINACLERMAAMRAGRDSDRPLHLYWGARSSEDLYDLDAVGALVEKLPGVRFTPVLGQGHPDRGTRTGYVHRAVVEDFDDLSDYDIYACGAPGMIEALGRECAAERGFDRMRMVADVFSVGPGAGNLAPPAAAGPINLFLDRTVRPCAIAGVAGEALLFALKRAGVPLRAVCGGQGACGTCLVHIAPNWRRRAGHPAKREERLLQYLGAGEGDRLSCQIPLTADLDGLELHTRVENQGDSP
jgi:CDP-4-dehydro-6-deoxyglucose reductase